MRSANRMMCVLALTAVCASGIVRAQECATIAETATGAGLTSLAAALEAAGLAKAFADKEDKVAKTVFAPTNDAFAATISALGFASLEELAADASAVELLTKVLTLHVVPGAYPAASLSDGLALTTLEGSDLTVMIGDAVTVSSSNTSNATVTSPDAATGLCGGSVVHVIDAVLLPPTDAPAVEEPAVEEPMTVVDPAMDPQIMQTTAVSVAEGNATTDCATIAATATDAGLSSLVTALTTTGLAGVFSDEEDKTAKTVFAPTNEAFAAILEALGYSSLEEVAAIPDALALLTKVLTLHVVPGAYPAASLSDGLALTTLEGSELTVMIGDAVTVSSSDSSNATVTSPDAANGLCGGSVVHVIDAVLLPASNAPAVKDPMSAETPMNKKAPLYGQCGGKVYNGPTECASGKCEVQNEWYSQCLGDYMSEPGRQPIYGQCGGKEYSGITECVTGTTCTVINEWYSQCL